MARRALPPLTEDGRCSPSAPCAPLLPPPPSPPSAIVATTFSVWKIYHTQQAAAAAVAAAAGAVAGAAGWQGRGDEGGLLEGGGLGGAPIARWSLAGAWAGAVSRADRGGGWWGGRAGWRGPWRMMAGGRATRSRLAPCTGWIVSTEVIDDARPAGAASATDAAPPLPPARSTCPRGLGRARRPRRPDCVDSVDDDVDICDGEHGSALWGGLAMCPDHDAKA